MELTQTIINNLENTKYNELLKIGKELKVITQFKQKANLIEDIKKAWELKKEEPNINSLPIPKIKIEGEFEGEKKEIKKMTYKEPIGSLKEYKDGTYQLTEKGWKKIIPKTISL